MATRAIDLDRDEIEIDVIGKSAVGKTFIQMLITDMLISHGFKVKFNSHDDHDFDELKATMKPEIVKSVLGNVREIRVNEVQAIDTMSRVISRYTESSIEQSIDSISALLESERGEI